MKVDVKVKGTEDVKRELRNAGDRATRAFLDELDWVGLKVVTAIRTGEVSFWNDVTGNLRSSIGYLIVHDGREAGSNFEVVNGRGAEGKDNAMSFARELASRYPRGIALIIVAGMEYAEYVESLTMRRVLAGGELLANKLLSDLKLKWNARMQK